jgi:hypothetical protein
METLARLREHDVNANWLSLATSSLARFTLDRVDMDAICTQVWGLDGEGSFIQETIDSYGTTYNSYNANGTSQINLAMYNRTFTTGEKDAAGRTTGRRGFNDPTLYVARTTKSNVVEGYSYMIPLELVVRSPLEVWNPWNLNIKDQNSPAATAAMDGTRTKPWDAAYTRALWNLLPPKFFTIGITDPSDTVSGGVWIRATNGQAYPADNSGINITITNAVNYLNSNNLPISTVFRFRYPIAPLWHEFSYASIQANNLRNILKGLFKEVVNGTLSISDIDDLL